MKLRLAAVVVIALIALPLAAQLPPFGAPFPLANARYGATFGTPLLRTDGRDAFLFWAERPLFVTRLMPGERHIGRPIFDESVVADFDAVWTGDHFLVANRVDDGMGGSNIMGRLVDRGGRAIGDAFLLTTNGFHPRLAFNGTTVLLMYLALAPPYYAYDALALDPMGRALRPAERIGVSFSTSGPTLAAANGRFTAIMQADHVDLLVMFDASGRQTSVRAIDESAMPSWAMASDGSRFLAITAAYPNATAMLLDGDGQSLRTMTFGESEDLPHAVSSAVWSGSKWVVSLIRGVDVRVMEIDSDVTTILSRRDFAAYTATLTSADGRVTGAFRADANVFTAAIPSPPGSGEVVTFAAAAQELLATATSADATLVVWRERIDGRNTGYVGIRTRDGRWRERVLGPDINTALAASDGHEFVAILNGLRSVRLSANGVPSPGTEASLPFGFFPTAIAWNGHGYGAIGYQSNVGIASTLLAPANGWSGVKIVTTDPGITRCPSLASDGSAFFAACYTRPSIIVVGPPNGAVGIRLDANGNTIGAPVELTKQPPTLGGVTWDGSRFVVGWTESASVNAAHVGASGIEKHVLPNAHGTFLSVAGTRGGTWFGWWSDSEYDLALVNADGSATSPVVVDHQRRAVPSTTLATLSDGTVLRLFTPASLSAPRYGEAHIAMQVGSYAIPSLPEAPRLTMKREPTAVRLEWTAPPQVVSGYRLEYAIGDGAWIEAEDWFDADRRFVLFPLSPNTTYSFRVRAFNDGGAGAYSDPVTVSGVKRRSVR